jgi:tetratricopeptide (TPR) repeat protein
VAAHSLIYSGEYDEAEEQLASLSASHPNHMYAVVLAAQLRAERGRGRSRAASALANAFGIDGRRTAETLDSPLIEGGRDRLIAVLQQVYALRPDDPWPRLSLAHHLAAEGRREAALKALPGLRDLDDAHAIVRYRHVLLSLDQDMEAYTAAQRAAKLAPDSDLAIYGALLALTELDRWGEAAEAAQRFVSLAEGTPEAYAAAGALMGAETPAGFRRGQAILDEGLRHYPAAPGILRWKAHGLHEAGRPADAAEAYSRLREADPEDLKAAAWLATTFADAGRTDKAIEEATRAMQQSPDSSVILRSRTYAHHTAEDYPSALAFYDRAVQADPLNAKALLARSMSRRRMNDAEGARRDEDRAIDLAGHHPEVYLSAAEGHGAVDSERRHEILRRGVEAHPYHMELRYALAWSYRDAGLERAARQTARAAIDVTSDAPLDQAWRATFLEAHLDDTDAAIDAGQRAVEGRPWDPEVVTDQAFRLSEVGRVDEAKALLLRAIETTPEAVGPHAVLGMLEQERGRWAESEAALSRALEIYEGYRGHPEHVTSLHAWRAEARLEMSAYAEALADAEAAIELGGEYAEYYRLRAEAHEGLGQATEARADRERASQLSPLEREHVWTRPS